MCNVAELQAYLEFTGNATPVLKFKNYFVISAHCDSKCIGVATFNFTGGKVMISLDNDHFAPIVEYSDTPFIFGVCNRERIGLRGAVQLNNSIPFQDCPEILLVPDAHNYWIRWEYTAECLYTQQELTKLHFHFGNPQDGRVVQPRQATGRRQRDAGRTRRHLIEVQGVPVFVFSRHVQQRSQCQHIQGRPVLYAVDRATRFQAARFPHDISTETIWKTFLQMWSPIYLGAPENLRSRSRHAVHLSSTASYGC